jgi:hypothetical protein
MSWGLHQSCYPETLNLEPQSLSHPCRCSHEAVLLALQPGTPSTGIPEVTVLCLSVCLLFRMCTAVLSASRALMPTSRILLLGLLPRFDIYTHPGSPAF